MSFETGRRIIRSKAVWGGAIRAELALSLFAFSGCGDLVREGTGSAYLIVKSIEAASGAEPNDFGGNLLSDVVTNVDGTPTYFNDLARTTFNLQMKDILTSPTPNNFITLTRYHVEFIRADGRNIQGVDVPYAFDGGITATVNAADTAVSVTIVRNQAKLEAPLANLSRNLVILSTIARITFYGHDQTGREASATAQISVDFANFGDPG
jgi:hypothetical protein